MNLKGGIIMGNPTGFINIKRKDSYSIPPKDRIKNFDEFHETLPEEERLQQASRCMDCGVPFCQSGMTLGGMTSGCPLNNLIPEWNDSLYKGNYEEAYKRLIKTNNFPEFTSRVCPALCEKSCTLGENDTPVASKENALTIIEKAYELGLACAKPPKIRNNINVAIIGSGPSGLAAADELNKSGYNVTVYDRNKRLGGLLMNGIPNMKLDKNVITRKIDILKEEGINFVTNANVGKDVKLKTLLSKYDKVILAIGSTKPRDINVKGRKGKDIYFAVDFLTDVNDKYLDNTLDLKKNMVNNKSVVIIGGGDTGNDCVGTCIRLGAKEVTQLEMLPKPPLERIESNPWPQWPKVFKTDYGQEEAIEVFGKDPRIFKTTVEEFIRNDSGDLTGIRTIKLDFDENHKLVKAPGTEKNILCDIVIISAGFIGPEEYLLKDGKIEIFKDHHATNNKKIYTTGDSRMGQSLVVKAIADGREVAHRIIEEII